MITNINCWTALVIFGFWVDVGIEK